MLIDAEFEYEPEEEDDVEHCAERLKVVRQSELRLNGFVYKIQYFFLLISGLFSKVIKLPIVLYSHFVQCTLEINNDFLTIQ